MERRRAYEAKPVEYDGVSFKSTMEAKWAAYFNSCDLAWEYEPRVWRHARGVYTPDFHIVGKYLDVYAEVKPSGYALVGDSKMNSEFLSLLTEATEGMGKEFLVLLDEPGVHLGLPFIPSGLFYEYFHVEFTTVLDGNTRHFAIEPQFEKHAERWRGPDGMFSWQTRGLVSEPDHLYGPECDAHFYFKQAIAEDEELEVGGFRTSHFVDSRACRYRNSIRPKGFIIE